MREVVLIRYSEIAVKGKYTRSRMVSRLINNISRVLDYKGIKYDDITQVDSRIVMWAPPSSIKESMPFIGRVFGVKSYSPAVLLDTSSLDEIAEKAVALYGSKIEDRKFMVRVRRVGDHNYTSKDAERVIGGALLNTGRALGVDLERPDYTLYVEIRGDKTFMYDEIYPGPGGLPLGSESKVLMMFSGGFDSTVASWMMMKRGSPVDLVYYDFGNIENWNTALEVARKLVNEHVMGQYKPLLYRVDFHDTVKTIVGLVRRNYRVLVIRRLMLTHSAKLALSKGYLALSTGESLGQVSSQTVESLHVISSHLQIPVLRPLIALDKDEIIELSRRISLFEACSRQREFCAVEGSRPTPRPNPQIFNEEYIKALMAIEDIWPPRIDLIRL